MSINIHDKEEEVENIFVLSTWQRGFKSIHVESRTSAAKPLICKLGICHHQFNMWQHISGGKRHKQSGSRPFTEEESYLSSLHGRQSRSEVVMSHRLSPSSLLSLSLSLSLAQLPNSHLENNFWPRGVVSTPTLAFSWLKIFIGQIIF